MRLIIAEKPSLGRAIAEVLPKPHKKGNGYISAANGDTVSWCVGHLLEQQKPEAYDAAYKKWSHEHLPIIPQHWKLAVKKQTDKQLGVLRTLVKQAEQLVHAGDPDREGQLLVDEVINFLGVTGAKKNTIQRCLINDLNPSAVKQSLSKLRSNREFIPLSTSALARSRADWLYGINLTRAYTLQGQKVGYKGVLSVGRVQTPLLGLVVRRDKTIEDFVSKAFYEVWACLETDKGERFKAKWKPSEQCAKYLDEQGRNLSQALAHNVAARVSQQPAQVKNLKREHKRQAPPLPYNLSSLQIDASKAFGLSAQQILDICQGLYERHKLITYPRSDCRYLPISHFAQAKNVHAAVVANSQHMGQQGSVFSQTQFDLSLKSKAWNDKKVDAHHAIIPTQKISSHLSGNDLSAHEFYGVRVEVEIASGLFVAVAKELIVQGWKCLFPKSSNKNNHDTNSEAPQLLPSLNLTEILESLQAEVQEKHTSPPKAYTDSSLLAAMTGISAHVSDPQLRKILRDTDGLGTEATRAGIIELLFSRGFLSRSGKTITSTVTGRSLIEALPDVATYPDMTARWEAELSAISEGKSQYKKLMCPLEQQLKDLVVQSREIIPQGLSGLGKNSFTKKRRSSTTRKYVAKKAKR
jgi:DNA topoisomerase-3